MRQVPISPKQIRELGFTAYNSGLDRYFVYGESGYWVRRAPHPTCIWPWYGLRPDGEMILHPGGHAFMYLRDALIACRDEVENGSRKPERAKARRKARKRA